MAYTRTYGGLYLCSLTAEQHARTCGYWWTVTDSCAAPHTAFRTLYALTHWLERCGLQLTQELPPQGTNSVQALTGCYREMMHMELTRTEFDDIPGERFRALSNGSYTQGIVTRDADGIVTLHTMNPNCRDRAVFDYWESDAMTDTGHAKHCRHCGANCSPRHQHCPACGSFVGEQWK